MAFHQDWPHSGCLVTRAVLRRTRAQFSQQNLTSLFSSLLLHSGRAQQNPTSLFSVIPATDNY